MMIFILIYISAIFFAFYLIKKIAKKVKVKYKKYVYSIGSIIVISSVIKFLAGVQL